MQVTTIGIALAKSVFQVHGVDATGGVSVKKKLRRAELLAFFQSLPPCLVGIEACATAHFWAREIGALGHEVRLMPPSYVKAYVRRQKNDAADAAAICEAVTRPTMRLVAVKSAERQGVLVLHRTRELLVRQRTMLINPIAHPLPSSSPPFARPACCPPGCHTGSSQLGLHLGRAGTLRRSRHACFSWFQPAFAGTKRLPPIAWPGPRSADVHR